MAQTDVKTSELDDKTREFKFHIDIDAPFDGQIIYLDLDTDWAYRIVDANGRTNAGKLDLTVKINGVVVSGYDPWTIDVGSVREQEPDSTGPNIIALGQQLLVLIEIPTSYTTPEKFKFELRCRLEKDNA